MQMDCLVILPAEPLSSSTLLKGQNGLFLLSVYNKISVRISLFFSQGFHMEVCQLSLSMCKNALQFSAHIRINGEGLQRESQYILPCIY